ncbi:MAG: exopolysaccharide biosynthesis protein [Cyanobacteria bacterium P01_H01_bin.130]
MASLSAELEEQFLGEDGPETFSLGDVLALAGERTFGFLFVLLSIPSALPIPAPGYSVPFGILLAWLAVQMAVGQDQPWLPKSWRSRAIGRERLSGLINAAVPWLRKLEILSRPRLIPICRSFWGRLILGGGVTLMGLSMIAPIPGTNTLPAMGIFVVGLGLVDDDGAIALLGATGGIVVTVSIWTAIIWGGSSLIDLIKGGLGS